MADIGHVDDPASVTAACLPRFGGNSGRYTSQRRSRYSSNMHLPPWYELRVYQWRVEPSLFHRAAHKPSISSSRALYGTDEELVFLACIERSSEMPSLYKTVGVLALANFVCEASSLPNCTCLANQFFSPPAQQRPRFRYWLPDASVNAGTVEANIKSAGAIGAGGIEFLPFYNYGGELGGPPPGVNWSTYGFGTPAHLDLFTSALRAHKEAGMVMDFSLGPNQGQGIPAHADDEGLQWDLVSAKTHERQLDWPVIHTISTQISTSQMIPPGGAFNGRIPGWLNGELVAAISAIVTSRTNVSFNVTGIRGEATVTYEDLVLQDGSLKDITSMISNTGTLSYEALETLPAGHEQELFFFYQNLSHNKNVEFASNATATIWDNGSYVVDHFSALGAKTVQAFWDKNILTDDIKGLLWDIGNYGISNSRL